LNNPGAKPRRNLPLAPKQEKTGRICKRFNFFSHGALRGVAARRSCRDFLWYRSCLTNMGCAQVKQEGFAGSPRIVTYNSSGATTFALRREAIMLVLSRKLGEKIYINENICITVVDIDRGKIRLGIEAPRDVPIFRQELLQASQTPAAAPPSASVGK
jgi:carbon storage regulator